MSRAPLAKSGHAALPPWRDLAAYLATGAKLVERPRGILAAAASFKNGTSRNIPVRAVLRHVQEGRCAYCSVQMQHKAPSDGVPMPADQETIDHVLARSRGETKRVNLVWNFVLVCHRCNHLKGHRLPTREELEAHGRIVRKLAQIVRACPRSWHEQPPTKGAIRRHVQQSARVAP